MLYQWIRTLHSDDGTLTDYSLQNQDESSTIPMALVLNEDYLYLGQHYPFNNFFVDIDTVNDVSAIMSIQYWDAREWRDAVDILDGTSSGGVSLAKSGVVQFSPQRNYVWNRTNDTTEGNRPTELESVEIYNMYWMRIKFSASLNVATTVNRFVYAFTTHQQIDNLDTTVNDYLTSFSAGKTTWNDEIITASILVVHDLRSKGLIVAPGEILRFDDVSMATDWKTLILIYRNLGGDYSDKLKEAKLEYVKAINLKRFTIDKDNDGYTDLNEISNRVSEMTR